MPFGILRRIQQKRTIKNWRNSAIGQELDRHTKYFLSNKTILGSLSSETLKGLAAEFYRRVFSIPEAENPFLKYREELCAAALEFAKFQVLCLKPDEKQEAFYSNCPYISAELYRRIRDCAKHNKELGEILWKNENETDDKLIGYANAKSALYLYHLNGLNLIRAEFGDMDLKKDWFRPFVTSMLIWEEHSYREKVSLPSLLPGGMVDALMHSTFVNQVVRGEKNPLFGWEKHYGLVHSEVTQ